MSRTKTPNAATAPSARTRAFEHGVEAWGARFVVPGTTTSPERDLWLALGWPEVRFIVAGGATPDADWRVVLGPSGRDVPEAHAAARIRGHAEFRCDPSGSPTSATLTAIADTRPFDAASASAFIHEQLAAAHLSMGNADEVVLGLEALVGPDVVLTAIIEAFEATATLRLCAHDAPRCGWARTAATQLSLRVSRAVGDDLRARMLAIVERGFTGEVQVASVASELDRALQQERARHPSRFTSAMAYWSDVPRPVLLETLGRVVIDKWSITSEPRLVMLGGDAVIDFYRAKWHFLADAPRQRELVERFSELASPRLRELMQDLAEKSKAKKDARAWLDRAPVVVVPAAAPVTAPVRTAPTLAALDPGPLLAQLDAAVQGNDWPDFFELNPEDLFHGLRVIGARRGSAWGIVFERLQGDAPESLMIRSWTFGDAVDPQRLTDETPISLAYDDDDAAELAEAKPKSIAKLEGTALTGPRGAFVYARSMGKAYALEDCKKLPAARFATLARAYHAHFDGGLWPEARASIQALRLGPDADIVLVSDAFEHVVLPTGGNAAVLPSASDTLRSLCTAVAVGDAARFDPGTPNTRRVRG